MQVITSGSTYIDIDAYAACVAYAELLNLQGQPAQAVSTAPLNQSITKTIRSWQAPLLTNYEPSPDDRFVLLDVSDQAYCDTIVDPLRVAAVIDHHPGFEAYWQERIGQQAQIEFIGAACTLVYERWRAAGLVASMSQLSARLLACGILDNTLNFGAQITTPRDTQAYQALLAKADLPAHWPTHYFKECQVAVLQDISRAVEEDTKVVAVGSFGQSVCFGQLVVWDAQPVLAQSDSIIHAILRQSTWPSLINLISVSEQQSYFVADSKAVQIWLSQLLGVTFRDSVAPAERLWLRKEVIKHDMTV